MGGKVGLREGKGLKMEGRRRREGAVRKSENARVKTRE